MGKKTDKANSKAGKHGDGDNGENKNIGDEANKSGVTRLEQEPWVNGELGAGGGRNEFFKTLGKTFAKSDFGLT